MSGLAGCLAINGAAVDPQIVRRMAESTPYLAPDGVDVWSDGPVGFVRFRHATTPQFAWRQPITDDRSALTLCFDGRLDNRDDLLRDLRGVGGLDADASDDAIVLALFARDGDTCVKRLAGDYAFAVWQARTRRLFCARSPVGWRPFFWCRTPAWLGFATEPKTLVDGLRLDRRINEGAVAEYLSLRFTTQTDTFWRDIQRLPPGSALAAEADRVWTWHWHTGPFPETSHFDESEHVRTFRRLFDQSIAATLRSSTPVAAHLSGGLDSSSIVCRATELQRTGAIGAPVRPVSARFPGELHDETEWSRAVEDHLGIQALVVSASPYDWDRASEWCSRTLHLPLRPNVLGTIVATCERLRADGVRVLLTGEGGDDWLRGSRAHWPDLLRRGQVRQLLREGLVPGGQRSLARRLAHVVRHSAGPLLFSGARERLERPHLDFSDAAPDWIRADWAISTGLRDRWRSDRLPVDFTAAWLRQRYAPYILARRHVNVDNVVAFATGEGVELRHPLHDLRLTEYLLGAPGGLFLRGTRRKHLLREAMRGVLPETVRLRDTKANFSTPFVDALLHKLSDGDVDKLEVVRRGWVDGRWLSDCVSVYRQWNNQGRRQPFPVQPLAPVWSAVTMDLWLTRAFKS
jgi:asparagine synthase (glutamine-hydrolysing)